MIDLNAWLGPWPFALEPERSPAALVRSLAAVDVDHAAVSHLGAVFAPDPMPANLALLRACRRQPALLPVPVINPALAPWAEHLATCRDRGGIRGIRLLPNYHGYALDHPGLLVLLDHAADTQLPVFLNVRLADSRTQYFGLNIRGVPVAEIAALLAGRPHQHLVLCGLHRPELTQLAADHANFTADLSFCEWRDLLPELLQLLPARRLVLGTATPLLSLRAGVDQLRLARLPARARRTIGETNARRLLRL